MNISEISIGSVIADQGVTFVVLDTKFSCDNKTLECLVLTTERDLISYTLHCDDKGEIEYSSFACIVDNIMEVYTNLRSKLYKEGINKLGDITI